MFSNKIFSKFIRAEIRIDYKWHLIRVLIYVRSRLPQILAGSDSTCSILENDEFWNKWIAFLHALLTRHYHSTTARCGLRNDLKFSLNIDTGYTRIPTFRVLFLPCGAKKQKVQKVAKFLFQ